MEAQIALRSYQRESISHSHAQYHQIIYPLTGVLQLRLGSATGYVQQRMYANIEARTEHEFSAARANEFLVLDLPCDLADNITNEITDGRQKTFNLGADAFLQ